MGTSTAALELIVKLRDEASSKMSGIGNTISTAFGVVTGGLIAGGLDAIAGSVGGLVKGMVDGNAEFERYQTQFGVLLGGAEAAKQRLDELAKFGASTPFELPEVVRADKILQGFGLHSEEAAKKFGMSGEQIRTIAGDVASGTGSSFEEMSLLIGKFSAGATGEAISRMAELGITNRDELKKMGLEFSKSGELLSPLPQAMETVLGLMKGKFGGMMDAQSQTFEGMMSNLQDWAAGTLRTVGQPIFEVLKEKLQGLLTFLSSPGVQTAITSLATGLAEGIGGAITFLVPLVQNLITFIGNVATVIGPVITTVANFVSGLISGGAGVSTFGTDISNTFLFIQGIVQQVMPLIAGIVENGVKLISEFWDENGDEIIAFVQSAWDTINDIINIALELIQAIVVPILTTIAKFIEENGDQIKAAFKTAWDIISGIIRFAMNTIKTVISLALAIVKGDTQSASNILQNIWTNLRNAISNIVNGIASAVSGKFNEIKNNIVGSIQSAFDSVSGLVNNFISIGAGIINSIMTGIRNAADGLFNALRGAVLSAIEGALSIFPPFIQDAIRSIINPGGGGRSGSSARTGAIFTGSAARIGETASGSTFVFNIDARGGANTLAIEQAVERAMLVYGRRADTRIRTA